MFWLIIILCSLCLFLCWLLASPVELEIDTVNAYAGFHWSNIGSVCVWYDNEWWLSFQLFFFRKTIPFSKIKKRPKKATATPAKREQHSKPKSIFKKVIQVIGTLQVTEWQLAIDSGRFDLNARLYPLNFLSCTSGHLFINFHGNNYLIAKLRGRPWKIVFAFIK